MRFQKKVAQFVAAHLMSLDWIYLWLRQGLKFGLKFYNI